MIMTILRTFVGGWPPADSIGEISLVTTLLTIVGGIYAVILIGFAACAIVAKYIPAVHDWFF